jgi:hypothetical protein
MASWAATAHLRGPFRVGSLHGDTTLLRQA